MPVPSLFRFTGRRAAALLLVGACVSTLLPGCGEQKKMLSIASGGTGGVYYPLGGGLANILSTHLPGYQVTSEVTGGSIDNLKLVGSNRADIAFSMVDVAWDAHSGTDKFKDGRLAVRTLAVIYPNRTHVVTVNGTGIESMRDLKGKRVSLGAPGSASEVLALRVLQGYGLLDGVTRERLSVAESVNAMKDRKIDAFFWVGGLPTAAVSDLAATPGTTIRFLDHAEVAGKLNAAYGPMYSETVIPKDVYTGMQRDNRNLTVWNILVVAESMPETLAHDIVKVLFEQKQALVAVHKEAGHIDLSNQSGKLSPVPFHPGALRYYREKGVQVE
ncbi:MAG TPA: TAXI family TRAP transporter solute-binding subunit [Burkholderiales bacterium]